jgi:UDP-N-acetylglucosamine/UDP-N-acetylgalactosamine diphosphorylase
MSDRLTVLRDHLGVLGYASLLAGWDHLDEAQKSALVENLESHDLDAVHRLAGSATERAAISGELSAPKWYSADPALVGERSTSIDAAAAARAGESLLARGSVAVCTVAGGQGTRLGWRGPKGTYPATPVTGKSLFGCQAQQILHAQRTWGVVVPWYIMTSEENDEATRAFFSDNNCFGLRRSDIFMVLQGRTVSVDAQTRVPLLATATSLATNPDGHGGVIAALHSAGSLEDMATRGIEHISYVQIDNPLARLLDPVFLGLHIDESISSGEFSSKMVVREEASERVGVFAQIQDHVRIVEYSDLPAAAGEARNNSGELELIGGNPAIHLLAREFVETLATGDPLPWHEANKVMACFDPCHQRRVDPNEPNATKFERNEAGDVLGRIEISPLTAMSAEDLKGHTLPEAVGQGDFLAL